MSVSALSSASSVLADDTLEDVEAVLPIGREDVGMELSVRAEAHGAAIGEPAGALLAGAEIGNSGRSVLGPGRFRR